jgi:hypothetical protein
MCLRESLKKKIFCSLQVIENSRRKESDLELDPDPELDPELDPDPEMDPDPELDPDSKLDPDSEPDPLVRGTGTDPRIRIRNQMSRIPNTANEDRGYLGNGGGLNVASVAVEEHLPSSGRTHVRDLNLAAGTLKLVRGKHPLKKLDLAKNSRTSQQVKGTGKKAIFAVPTFFCILM